MNTLDSEVMRRVVRPCATYCATFCNVAIKLETAPASAWPVCHMSITIMNGNLPNAWHRCSTLTMS